MRKSILSSAVFLCIIVNVNSSVINFSDTVYVQNLLDSALIFQDVKEEKSFVYAKEALRIARNCGFVEKEVDAIYTVGYLYCFNAHKFDSGFHYINTGFEIAKKLNYTKGLADYNLLQGIISNYQGNYKLAKKYFTKALEYASIIGNLKIKAHTSRGKGICHLQLGELEEAISLFVLAGTLYNKIEDFRNESNVSILSAVAYTSILQVDSANYYFEKNKAICKNIDYDFGLVEGDVYWSDLYLLKGDTNSAIQLLDKVLIENTNTTLNSIYISAAYKISNIYEHKKKYKLAFHYKNYARSITDSTFGLDGLNRIYELQIAHYNAEKEKETLRLNQANELKNLRLENKQKTMNFVIIMLLQALVVIALLYWKYCSSKKMAFKLQQQQQLIYEKEKEIIAKENERIKSTLDSNRRDLTSKAIQLYQHNEHIKRLENNLQRIKLNVRTKGRTGELIRNDIQSIINELKFVANKQIWKEFEHYFNKVNPGLIEQLLSKFPNLSQNEIRLCVFSMLCMKTKEIANITFQSVKTINVAKTRLRKKLEIENPAISLISFLQQMSVLERQGMIVPIPKVQEPELSDVFG